MRDNISTYQRWVVKVGSALLTDDGAALNKKMVLNLAEQIQRLRQRGVEVILVSSGAVACGLSQLSIAKRPNKVSVLQAAAAVGQANLIQAYKEAFQPYQIDIAQVLFTRSDIVNRERYLNAKSTLLQLLEFSILPIINENDTVATEEICFSDNDNLAALAVNLLEADLFVVLTDQLGLYDQDPRKNQQAKLISLGRADDASLLAMASGGSDVGRGGMKTKVEAAKMASLSGAHTVIASGREKNILDRIYSAEEVGTFLVAESKVNAKKTWIVGQGKPQGRIVLDAGACHALIGCGSSLLAVGVQSVSGEFERGALIDCLSESGEELAVGLTNFSSQEIDKIKGKTSIQVDALFGYGVDEEIIHRNNLVLLNNN